MSVQWKGAELLARIRAGAMTGVVRGTEFVREEGASLMLNSPRGGRVYRRRGVTHKASAPGEPPAPDTGTLMRNIDARYDKDSLTGTVNFGTVYARALEYGTARMAARPFARPALMNKVNAIKEDVADEIANALR